MGSVEKIIQVFPENFIEISSTVILESCARCWNEKNKIYFSFKFVYKIKNFVMFKYAMKNLILMKESMLYICVEKVLECI